MAPRRDEAGEDRVAAGRTARERTNDDDQHQHQRAADAGRAAAPRRPSRPSACRSASGRRGSGCDRLARSPITACPLSPRARHRRPAVFGCFALAPSAHDRVVDLGVTRSRCSPRRGSTRRVDRRLHALEHRLGVHAEEHDQAEQRGQDQPLAARTARRSPCCPRRARRGTPAGRPTAGRGRRGSRRPAATIVHQRRVRNDPTSTRNSPTNPLSPGRPIDDSITSVNTAGEDRRHLLQAPQRGDLAGVAALGDHADQQEQRAGRQAVVDVLQQRRPGGPGW